MSAAEAEKFLEHYGVPGMKWGVRKARDEGERKAKFGASKDSKKASTASKKAKTSGIKSLSNQELKDLNQRMELEQKYSQLTAKTQTKSLGQKFMSDAGNMAMNIARTQAQNYMNKQISALLNQPKKKTSADLIRENLMR